MSVRIEVLNGIVSKEREILIFGGDNSIYLYYGDGKKIIKLREKKLRLNFRHGGACASYGCRLYFLDPFLRLMSFSSVTKMWKVHNERGGV